MKKIHDKVRSQCRGDCLSPSMLSDILFQRTFMMNLKSYSYLSDHSKQKQREIPFFKFYLTAEDFKMCLIIVPSRVVTSGLLR